MTLWQHRCQKRLSDIRHSAKLALLISENIAEICIKKVSVKKRTKISENIRCHLSHLGHLTGSGGERGQQAFTVSPSTQSAVTWSLQEKTLITNFVSFLYHVCNFLNKERENLAEKFRPKRICCNQ